MDPRTNEIARLNREISENRREIARLRRGLRALLTGRDVPDAADDDPEENEDEDEKRRREERRREVYRTRVRGMALARLGRRGLSVEARRRCIDQAERVGAITGAEARAMRAELRAGSSRPKGRTKRRLL